MINLPILTIRQPWAWAIIHAGKDIENRDWKPRYRGRFWVHTSAKIETTSCRDVEDILLSIHHMEPYKAPSGFADLLLTGGIIGSVELVDVVEQSDSPWFFGKYGYVLRDPKPCEFIPMKGQLGFFRRPELEGKS